MTETTPSINAPVPDLHPSIVALIALSANIAANHPKQGLCQLDTLRNMRVPETHIQTVIEIARHIRTEAGEMLDTAFDTALTTRPAEAMPPTRKPKIPKGTLLNIPVSSGACCTPTASGKSCC